MKSLCYCGRRGGKQHVNPALAFTYCGSRNTSKMLQFDFLDDLRRMNMRQYVYNFHINSGSMEPAFQRGDLLFLTNYEQEPIRAGEIVVFKVEGRDIPIVHRVMKVHEKEDGSVKFLTKGDNNNVDDRGLYANGQAWLNRKDVVGRARGYVPFIGIVTIIMNDYPKFKYAVLAGLGIFVLIHRE
ncbi:Signal peptidase complex catalytic subunit SEC11C [Portunus trituberculatus]|uniref:Signal peptidase complex catalytic subunit SEC11 n=1 Tax=Portunus trituberculatus TaxID=210409 RepID=A0A5B7E234_PORTR|nr:Signal peptidase complex catalytic subunit SEC11C [Portunus trituberculatus]